MPITLTDILAAYRAAMDAARESVAARKEDDAASIISSRCLALQSTTDKRILDLCELLHAAACPKPAQPATSPTLPCYEDQYE